MGEFLLTGKCKVSRILPAVEKLLSENILVTLIGINEGSIKAVTIAEKIKKTFPDCLQINSIYEKDKNSVLEIKLTIN